ncbi:hypothetical protein DPMN_097496 [Dreissena polymorpha]|uniref:Uncharacterized protein n=1 Tax=Dreissena polymorpha TaxID=45954 RepID=A0A9D4LDD8_DREPO|nr:hypothetical protein DPMN_097496 [Dreissena polymorpha]
MQFTNGVVVIWRGGWFGWSIVVCQTDRLTDRRTDGQTDDRYMPSYRGRAKPPPSPLHFSLEPIGIQLPCVATWRQCIGLVVERLCTDSNVAWQSLPSDSAGQRCWERVHSNQHKKTRHTTGNTP